MRKRKKVKNAREKTEKRAKSGLEIVFLSREKIEKKASNDFHGHLKKTLLAL